jgi:hypothetical protein
MAFVFEAERDSVKNFQPAGTWQKKFNKTLTLTPGLHTDHFMDQPRKRSQFTKRNKTIEVPFGSSTERYLHEQAPAHIPIDQSSLVIDQSGSETQRQYKWQKPKPPHQNSSFFASKSHRDPIHNGSNLAKKPDGVAIGQYYQDPIDIELQKLKSSQALKEKFKKIKRRGRFLSYEKKVSVPYMHDLTKTERVKGPVKSKYAHGEGFNASTGPEMEAYQLFGTDYNTQPTGLGSSEEIAGGSELITTKIFNEEGYFDGALDLHRKSKF